MRTVSRRKLERAVDHIVAVVGKAKVSCYLALDGSKEERTKITD